MKTRLLFDLRATQPDGLTKRHGGGIYGEIVFFRMLEMGCRFSAVYDSRIWLNPKVKAACEQYKVKLYDYAESTLNDIVSRNHIERIYSPVFNDKLYTVSCEVYYTLHGLRWVELPADWYILKYSFSISDFIKLCIKKLLPRRWMNNKIRKALPMLRQKNFHFITVSNHSKYSILSYFPFLDGNQIKVFYSPDTTSDKQRLISSLGNYYLIVSGNRWEKNSLRAIIALDALFEDGRIRDKEVVVTGLNSPAFHYKLKHPDHFHFVGYVNDEKLNELYANCFSLVYPSLNEGFGYPPLEAMRYKKPVLASPYTSIAEVCSNGAMYFNPYDLYEIKSRILALEDNSIYHYQSYLAFERYNEIRNRQDKDLESLIHFITE